MKDYVSQRLRYFDGQFLDEADFNDEQKYHLNRRRLHNQNLHSAGIIEGLEVRKEDNLTVIVSRGFALDSAGNEIYLDQDTLVRVEKTEDTICVWIEYEEIPKIPQGKKGTETRFEEKVKITVSAQPIQSAKQSPHIVRLAQFRLTETENLPGKKGDLLDGVPKGVEPVRVFSGDRSVSVRKLKTELLRSGSMTLGTTDTAKQNVEVVKRPFDDASGFISAHLLVFACVTSEPTANEFRFSWQIEYGCILENGDTYRVQNVLFKTNSAKSFDINYRIYALLE